jgi:hypothetical protein
MDVTEPISQLPNQTNPEIMTAIQELAKQLSEMREEIRVLKETTQKTIYPLDNNITI